MSRRKIEIRLVGLLAGAALALGCGSKSDGAEGDSAADDGDGDGSGGSTSFGGDDGMDGPGDGMDTTPMTDGGDDMGFIDEPDGGVMGQCDPGAQDCPDGQKCTSYVSTAGGLTVDATKCVDIIGDDAFGETCERMTDNDTCAAGLFCMTEVSGNTGEGTCFEYCSPGMANQCENGGECFAFNDGALPLCERACNPLAPQECTAEEGCYAAFDGFVCAKPGHAAGEGANGSECFVIQGCQPGLICAGGQADCAMEGQSCCSPICDTGEANTCPDSAQGEACEAYFMAGMAPPGQESVGVCATPA